ncbi:MAG: DNA gyrase inhibitor YacG [Deltaproteobacteria bacterium]|nr:MAG: DNA gyrase inhibitor YacG [Deltaproteobacteria bacterium]
MKVRCPQCGKEVVWEENPYRPFCSERCKLIDLGRWIGEEYRLPAENDLPPEETEGDGEGR